MSDKVNIYPPLALAAELEGVGGLFPAGAGGSLEKPGGGLQRAELGRKFKFSKSLM